MPLRRSFDFLPIAFYKYAAPMGPSEAPVAARERPALPGSRLPAGI